MFEKDAAGLRHDYVVNVIANLLDNELGVAFIIVHLFTFLKYLAKDVGSMYIFGDFGVVGQ